MVAEWAPLLGEGHAFECECMWQYVYMCEYVSVYLYLWECVCVYEHVFVYMNMYMCVCMYESVHMCIWGVDNNNVWKVQITGSASAVGWRGLNISGLKKQCILMLVVPLLQTSILDILCIICQTSRWCIYYYLHFIEREAKTREMRGSGAGIQIYFMVWLDLDNVSSDKP